MIYADRTEGTSSIGKIYTNTLIITSSITLPTYSSAPSTADAGAVYYNTSDTNIYRSNGSTWLSAAGTSGTSGTTGTSGTAGTSGTSGSTGTSGSSGSTGTSGTSGSSGSTGTSGTSGSSGSSGTSGTSGSSGSSGTSGTTGTSGSTGTSGTSGTKGDAGSSGTSGTSGPMGLSGSSGTSGSAGTSGSSGTSGTTGTSGTSGSTGSSGTSGTGFSTISNASDNRVLTSDGSSNSANAESNFIFDGSIAQLTGSFQVSGSVRLNIATASSNQFTNTLQVNTLTNVVSREQVRYISTSIGDGAAKTFSITHSLKSNYVHVGIRDTATYQLHYPTVDTGSSMNGMFQVYSPTVDVIDLSFAIAPTTGQFEVFVLK